MEKKSSDVSDNINSTLSMSEEKEPAQDDTLIDRLRKKISKVIYLFSNNSFKDSVYTIYNYLTNKAPVTIVDPDNPIPRAVPESYDPLAWDNEVLEFEKTDAPLVSIIIPVYNKWGYTYNCLRSIRQTCSDCSYEIVIADDCSSDETAELEKYVTNVIHVRNEVNLNFLKNCNNAAKYANGKYLLFLNNDTLVQPDWLQSLIRLIESDRTIGMVGSKFIFPDGKLQEAGGIIWNDGTSDNYGRECDPSSFEFNYVKDVDYISGASIMIRSSLWEDIGGFDERYSPAYCEDSDLAFSVRDKGYRLVFQPQSKVIHFERSTQGENALKLCEANRLKLLDKWHSVMEAEHCPPKEFFIQRDRSKFKKIILVIDDMVPMFDQHAGGKTTYMFLQLLLDLGYKVIFFGNDRVMHEPYNSMLEQMGIETVYGITSNEGVFRWFDKYKNDFDTIFMNRPEVSSIFIDWFRTNTKAKIVYYGHDLHYLREMREYELTGDKRLLKRSETSKKVEYDIMSKSDLVLSVSLEEKQIIDREMNTESTIVVPIFFYRNFERKEFRLLHKSGLLFVGGYNHTPNVDAALWFVKEIFPKIMSVVPDIKLTLAGSHPTDDIIALESDSVHVTGYLTDDELDGLYDSSLISIVPLRFGAGVKGKTVDAMYHGMAVVSTSIGLEGLPGVNSCLNNFDDVDSFASEIIRLLSDSKAVEEQYASNVQYVKDTLSYESALEIFSKVFGTGYKDDCDKCVIK